MPRTANRLALTTHESTGRAFALAHARQRSAIASQAQRAAVQQRCLPQRRLQQRPTPQSQRAPFEPPSCESLNDPQLKTQNAGRLGRVHVNALRTSLSERSHTLASVSGSLVVLYYSTIGEA